MARTLSDPIIPIQQPAPRRDLRTWAAAAAAALGLGLYASAVLDLASMPASAERVTIAARAAPSNEPPSPPNARHEPATEAEKLGGVVTPSKPEAVAALVPREESGAPSAERTSKPAALASVTKYRAKKKKKAKARSKNARRKSKPRARRSTRAAR